MILENYNDSLKENVETGLSFTVNAYPIVQVRPFDSEVYADQDFVLSYFVDGPQNISYENDVLYSTFTVIVSLDEDTKSESQIESRGYRWKQTTYSGEQVINLGKITELGEHTLSIKAIESTGIASDTKFFKFYVTEHIGVNDIVDFSNVDYFESSETGFQWKTWSPFWFIRPADNNGHYQTVCIYKYNTNNTCSESTVTRNINYRIEFIRESGVLTGIDVKVNGTIVFPYQQDDQSRYPLVTTIHLNGESDNQESQGSSTYYGTYQIKNTCSIDGQEVSLEKYLSKDTDDSTLEASDLKTPPAEATVAASRNKIGIQFLLWACDAYCKQNGYKGFKLPKFDYIISYANALDFSETSVIESLKVWPSTSTDHTPSIITPITGNIDAVQLTSRNDIWFPNKDIIMDFNYSTIRSLNYSSQVIASAKIVQIRKGRNVKLMNLHVIGDYCNANTSKSDGKYAGEARSGVKLARCRFATLENVRISHTMGYEMTGENGGQADYNQRISVFNKFGYIDYNGAPVTVERQKSKTGSGNEWTYDDGVSNIMYTENFTELGSIVTGTQYNRAFHIVNSTLSSGNAGVGASGRYRSDGDAIFVSFYNNSNKFIKTIKIRLWDTGFVPYGATKCRFSAIGCIAENSINSLVKTRSNGSVYSGLYIASVPDWSIGNRIINCIVHDTRTNVVSPCGLQGYVNGLITFNIAGQGESKGKVTSQLCDVEDAALNHYHIWWNRWSHIGGLYGVINAQHGNDICCIECSGLSILHKEIRDGLISNSIIGLDLEGPTIRIIRKNIQITNSYIRSRISYEQSGDEYPMVYYLKNCFIANIIGDETIEEINNTENTPIKITNYGN